MRGLARMGRLLALTCAVLAVAGLAGCGAPVDGSVPPSAAPPSPFQRVFGPEFRPVPPAVDRLTIDGALLARDRRSIAVSFVGGKAYKQTDPCSVDYEAWAGLDGDTLAVTVAEVAHPEQARGDGDVVCTMEGYGYLFTIVLPAPFQGREVTDLASGPLWIPPPEAVAEVSTLPPDWILTSLFSEQSTAELNRTYQPRPGTPGDPGRFIALHQAFGGPTSNVVDAPIANGTIHGSVVPIGRNGAGFAAGWVAGSDSFWFTVVDPAVDLDAFVAMANGVQVPAP